MSFNKMAAALRGSLSIIAAAWLFIIIGIGSLLGLVKFFYDAWSNWPALDDNGLGLFAFIILCSSAASFFLALIILFLFRNLNKSVIFYVICTVLIAHLLFLTSLAANNALFMPLIPCFNSCDYLSLLGGYHFTVGFLSQVFLRPILPLALGALSLITGIKLLKRNVIWWFYGFAAAILTFYFGFNYKGVDFSAIAPFALLFLLMGMENFLAVKNNKAARISEKTMLALDKFFEIFHSRNINKILKSIFIAVICVAAFLSFLAFLNLMRLFAIIEP